jgi:hypothetical protein
MQLLTSKPSKNDPYGDKEAQRRFEAALRGSREVGHKTMKSMTPKEPKRKSAAARIAKARNPKASG